jgi:hypothetical protein
VVTISPGPFLTPWRTVAAAILDMGMAGEQEGNAVADVLFGDVVPAGKMPHTMPNKWNEVGMTQRQYPGTPAADPAKECLQQATPPQPNGLNPENGQCNLRFALAFPAATPFLHAFSPSECAFVGMLV